MVQRKSQQNARVSPTAGLEDFVGARRVCVRLRLRGNRITSSRACVSSYFRCERKLAAREVFDGKQQMSWGWRATQQSMPQNELAPMQLTDI